MWKARRGLGIAAILVWGNLVQATAQDNITKALSYRPIQPGVVVSTPTPDEKSRCKLEAVDLGDKKSAFELRDPEGKLLRRFVDTTGDGKIHVWSYYRNGVEVYREIDSDGNQKADQFRWLNAGGMKWGVSQKENDKIDGWRMISVEEVAQELVAALATQDYPRLQALMITEAEMKMLELPAAEATRIRDLRTKAISKFQGTSRKLAHFTDKTRMVHVDTEAPQCLPADQTKTKYDLIKHGNVSIMCETAGKTDWIQAGELIQVGLAWRLIDAPSEGMAGDAGPVVAADPEVQELRNRLIKLDTDFPGGTVAADPKAIAYYLKRHELLGKIAEKLKGDERDQTIREMADALGAASQGSGEKDKTAYQKLLQLEEQVSREAKGSNVAAYVTFREVQADYSNRIDKDGIEKAQKELIDRLTKFVQAYPKSDDTPEALLQLGMVNEFISQEISAKNWYQQLVRDFSNSPAGMKGTGALRRLDLEGKPMQLAAPQLGSGAPFDITKLRGKIVVVYYWASWSQQALGDFAKLKLLLDEYRSQGLELVSISLDSSAKEAVDFLQKTPSPGTHLFKGEVQANGMESPLATQYGIMAPASVFLVGRDGNVLNRSLRVSNLADEIKKYAK